MISEKMKKLVGGSSAIRAMFEEGKRLAAIYGAENVYDFSLGNPNFPAPAAVNDAIRQVLDTVESTVVHGYMSNAGFDDVRQTVAESLNRRFGTAFAGKNILMSVGAAGALHVILKVLLNPGDEVLTFKPYFVEYGNYVGNYDGVLKAVPVDPVTFQPDPEALAAAVTEKTRAVIVNNPNNPTGVVYSEETIKKIAAVLEAKQKEFGAPIYLLADEPYRELAYDGVEVPYLTKYYANTAVCYSWSKSLSLPGERIGYLVLPDEMDGAEEIITAASIANRMLGYINAPSLMQLAVARCLDCEPNLSGYDRNRRLLYEGLTKLGFEAVKPEGTFYLWLKSPEPDEKKFVEMGKKYNLLMVVGSAFAWPGYVRLAYCVAEDMIRRSLPAFEKLAAEYGLGGK